MKTLKHIIIATFAYFAFFGGIALALPYFSSQQTLIPFLNSVYDLGTSTLRWREAWIASSTINNLTAGTITATSSFTFLGLGNSMLVGTNNSGVLVSTSTPTARNYLATTTTATSTFAGGFTAGNNAAFVVNQAATANSLYVTSSGNVGIGTAGPNKLLEVVGGATGAETVLTQLRSNFTTVNTASTLRFVNSTDNTSIVGSGEISVIRDVSGNGSMQLRTYTSAPAQTVNMTLLSSGNVGIGTTTPAAKLSVNQGGATTLGMYLAGYANASVDLFRISTSTLTATSTAFVINSNGKVGVGTTTPYAQLSVAGLTASGYYQADYTTATSTFAGYLSTTQFANTAMTAGSIPFYGAGGFMQQSNANFFYDAVNNRLGLGTTSPSTLLSVSGSSGLMLTNTGAGNTFYVEDAANDTTPFVIDASGNVGIGTAAPLSQLHIGNALVGGEPTYRGNIIIDSSQTDAARNGLEFKSVVAGSGYGYRLATIQLGDYIDFSIEQRQNSASWTRSLTVQGSNGNVGNVGIGTTSPWGQLSVTNTSANPSFIVEDSASPDSSPFIIDASGNVGIGTTSPATSLDVNGTITQLTVKSCTLGLTSDALGSITGCVSSDEKLKTNISELYPLVFGSVNSSNLSNDPILLLHPIMYQWKNTKNRDTQFHAGFIAQEVQKVIPNAVSSAGTGLIGVDANAILAYVVKFVQGMWSNFQALTAKVSGLESKLTNQQMQIDILVKTIQLQQKQINSLIKK